MRKIRNIIVILTSFILGFIVELKIKTDTEKMLQSKIDKFFCYYNILAEWLELKQKGVSIEDFFIKNDFKRIAIYGMGKIGNLLYEELKKTEIEVAYLMDQTGSIEGDLEVISVSKIHDMEEVDVIVVTASNCFDVIEANLSKKVYAPVISIKEIVYCI